MLYEIFMFILVILALIILLIANPLFVPVDGGSFKAIIIAFSIICFSFRILEGIGIRGDISAFIICLSIGWLILLSVIHDPINKDNDLKDNELTTDKSKDSKLTCEICGNNDLVKENGLYVCQHCGTKYTAEEARQLFNSVTLEKDKKE